MEQRVVRIVQSPATPRVEVACGVALTVVPPYGDRAVTVQVVRHRTDSLESRQGLRTRQLPDAVAVTLDLLARPQADVIFDDWKATVRLITFGEADAEIPGTRAYEFCVTGVAPPPRD